MKEEEDAAQKMQDDDYAEFERDKKKGMQK